MIYRIVFLWLVLFLPSTSGWAKEHFPFLGEVVSDKVTVRAGGNVNFERIDQLPVGANVIVFEEQYGWYKIQLPATSKAYIRVDYLSVLENQAGQISGNRVNIRAGRGVNFSALGQLKKGDYIRLVSKMDDWFQIEPVEGLYGWISKDFVKVKSSTVPSLENLGFTRVTAASLQKTEKQELLGPSFSVVISGAIKKISSSGASSGTNYQITGDDQMVYDLRLDPSTVGDFVGKNVRLEGSPVSGTAPVTHSLIFVKKFGLIL